MQEPITINDFSQHLFWDVYIADFDLDIYKTQMVSKVLEYGNWQDWNLLKKYYGLETIKEIALNLRSLDTMTLTFLSAIFKIDKTNFRCYKHRQLYPTLWNS